MKKTLYFLAFLLLSLNGFAQISDQDRKAAMSLIESNLQDLGMSADDIKQATLSATYRNNDIQMVYLQQTYLSVPVFNSMQVFAFRNGKVVSAAGKRIEQMSQKVNASNAIASINAGMAVAAAMKDRGVMQKNILFPSTVSGSKIYFGTQDVSRVSINAELVWLPLNDKEIKLTWQVELAPLNSEDHWLIRVDASSGVVLDKNNFTVYESLPQEKMPVAVAATESVYVGEHIETSEQVNAPEVVTNVAYRVVPFPAESPSHTGGTASIVNDPWLAAPGNATSLQWHYDGTTYHDSTRGNNVWAQEDRDNSNATLGKTAISTTAQPGLTFDFAPNYTLAPTTTTNQQFATTNLFYWNNIIHDITYLYGFNEASGNFQQNNQGRGGLGNDYVIADAQDAGGTNNANFSTPSDGSNPRMQMYLFTSTTPNRDGDLDNGIIVHEYGHGVSNRLTGGPANSSCLSNAEQGGEGWSDYLALMLTTNWATATVNDGGLSRPMGTYALGQAPTAVGIRTYPYSTNMAVNPWTYAMMAGTSGQVHTIGQIWCVALWEMTWEMIAQDGINPDLYNPAATGGNSAALKLVIEGMRLQPCSPGFIDARNAILKADTIFYGAKYSCAIWKAFAKRGMGKLASQGSSGSTTDQIADFTNNGSVTLLLSQSVTQQQEGLQVTYTNRVGAGSCSGISNFTLRDTLPLNVTYVSGGSYDAGTRVVSFPVNLAVGQSQDYSFTVQVNPGSYYAPVMLLDETVPGTTISSTWTTSSTTSTNWTTSTVQSTSAPNSLFSLNIITTSDQKIQTTNSISLPAIPPVLTFQGNINAEAAWDGGVVEISTDGGTNWVDLGPNMISGGYNGTLNNSGTNPIRGRAAFTASTGGFVKTTINLAAYGGQNVKFRFRFGSDGSVASVGWYLDDISIKDIAMVNMRSSLFNNANTRVAISDTFTLILPGVTCTSGSINNQPENAAICEGGSTSFSVNATGTNLVYQWQQSTNGGTSFSDIPGETGPALQVNAASASMNGYLFHCVINGDCTINLTSANAVLTVYSLPVAPGAVPASICGTGSVSIGAVPGAGEAINWYDALTGGTLLQPGSNGFVTPVISTTTVYYAEAFNSTNGCVSASRTPVTATVNGIPSAPVGTNGYTCDFGSVLISATTGLGQTIDWYNAPSDGSLLQAGTSSYTTSGISNSIIYYAEARDIASGCISATRTPVLAEVRNTTTSTTAISICSDQLPYTWNNQVFNAGGVYQVVFTNAAGCDSVATLLLDVAAILNMYDVTGGGSYPTGGAGVPVGLNGSQPGIQYQLLLNGAVSMGSIVTGTGGPIIFGNQTSEGTYTVIAAPSSLCPKTMNGSATVVVASAPPLSFTVTGGGTYCTGGSGLSIGLAGSEVGVSYQLQRANGTINVGAPVSGTGLAIGFGLQTIADSYTVLATNTTNTFTQQMANSVLIRIASLRTPSTPGAIAGPSDACPLIGVSNAIYTIRQASNATSYIWTAPAGATIIGSNTDTIVEVQYSNAFVSGNLSVQSVNACFNNAVSSIRNLAITKRIPGTPGSIAASSSNACAFVGNGNTITYTIRKVTYATNYDWTVTAGMNIISNFGDTGIVVSFNAGFSTGTVSVAARNNCATSALRSLTVRSTSPSAPGAISGPANVCSFIGQPVNAVYSIIPVNGASSYLWTVPANSTIVAGQGTASVEISFASTFTGGTLSVRSVAACGNSSARSLGLVKNVAKPGVISASAPACPLTTVTYSIAAVPFATSYQWSVPTNATYVSGQGTTSFVVTYKAAFVSGTVTVKSINNCSSSAVRSLSVDNSGCPAPVLFTKGVVEVEDVKPATASIFPNPVYGHCNVILTKLDTGVQSAFISIIDMAGRTVMQQNVPVVRNQGSVMLTMDLGQLKSGSYILQYRNKIGQLENIIFQVLH